MRPNKKPLGIELLSLVAAAYVQGQPAEFVPGPVVVERGLFYRIWQTAEAPTNSPPGEVVSRTRIYTELGNGLCYQLDGQWLDSQDLIELNGAIAMARHGPTRVTFKRSIDNPHPVDLMTVSGKRIQTRVMGLFYFDAQTGQTVTIALVRDSNLMLYPPNQVVYPDAFDRIPADIIYTYVKGGFKQSVVLLGSLPTPEAYGLNSSTTRLQVKTEFVHAPVPAVRQRVLKRQSDTQLRQAMNAPDLIDEILDFGDFWLPTGAAFRWDPNSQASGDRPATVRLPDPSDPEIILMGKQWTGADNRNILIESADYLDIAPKLAAALSIAASTKPAEARFGSEQTGEAAWPNDTSGMFQVSSVPYFNAGFALDYTAISSGAHSFQFNDASTYVISNHFSIGPDMAAFEANTYVKYASNAWTILYGPVSFPVSGLPAVFTSVEDNACGKRIPGSTGFPNYAASQAIWMSYDANPTTVNNVRIRWAQRGLQYDENPAPTLSHATFENCTIGVFLNLQEGNILTLSQVTSCSVPTPLYSLSGDHYGSITPDCGVISVASANDPAQDSASGDADKNSQSECSFVVVDSSRIVAAFFDTHLSEYGLGAVPFSQILSPRSIGWGVSTDGGATFTDHGALLPNPPQDTSQGDAGDPVMARDVANGTIYLLGNPSREIASWTGFRLWKSTDDGESFSLINTSVPANVNFCDKPMIAVNNFPGLSNSHHVYVAGTSWGRNGVVVTHSGDSGATFDGTQFLASGGHGADIAILPDGTVYVFYGLSRPDSQGGLTNTIEYRWLTLGESSWRGPLSPSAHPDSAWLYSTNVNGSGQLRRSNSADSEDYFDSNTFPRVAVNPINGRVYLVYADLPGPGSATDRGDIFAQEGIPNADGSLTWSGAIKVNNDRNQTDQWNPAVAVNPAGTELFIGYYSRQVNPAENDLIMAFGAKADISDGLPGATFDVIPISPAAFAPLFPGTVLSTPPDHPWLFDPVWPPTDVCLDSTAVVVNPCPSIPFWTTSSVYEHFMADDYTWAGSDGSYFYFAWCDRSDIYHSGTNSRPDPNIRLGKIRQ